MSQPKWNVAWTKTYIASGTVVVEADTKEEAETTGLWAVIGDLEGSMQYIPEEDTGDATLIPRGNYE